MGDSDSQPLMLMLYDTLRKNFGLGSNDLFQMEMPARLLEQGNYQYEGSDTINAQQIKPPSVAETEFRLADGMLNLSNLVGGPNGSKLSEAYREVLFGLAPSNHETAKELANLVPDQQHIFKWLYEEVQNFDPPSQDLLSMIPDDAALPKKPSQPTEKVSEHTKKLRDPTRTPKIPRIDLYQKLLDLYESERFRWAQFKNDAWPAPNAKQEAWNAYDSKFMTQPLLRSGSLNLLTLMFQDCSPTTLLWLMRSSKRSGWYYLFVDSVRFSCDTTT